MQWPEFLEIWARKLRYSDRNPNKNTPPKDRFLDLEIDCKRRHTNAILYLINNAGGKPRFKMLWSEEITRHLSCHTICSPEWWKIVEENPPLEIKCVQGGGGEADIDEEDCIPIPEDHDLIFHGSYLACLKSMLMGPGVLAGGRQGFSHRNRIYGSCADWTLYDPNYVHEERPFTEFRNEPYMPRSDWNMQVALSVPHCRETGGTWLQTTTLAAVATLKWHAQPICIEYAIDRKGWILYRRPPPIQPFNAFADQSDADYGQQHPVCHRCSRPNPRGLVYCFHCCAILEGAVEENIFETRKR